MRTPAERPVEELEAMKAPSGHPFRGVEVRRGQNRDQAEEEIAVVRLQVCRFDDPDQAEAAGVSPEVSDYFVPNIWPTSVEGLEAASA